MTKSRRSLAFSILVFGLLTALDQLTKLWAQTFLIGSSRSLIPGVLELYYLENRGVAFGLLQGKRILFLVIGILFFAVCLYIFRKIPADPRYHLLHTVLVVLCAGAMGNFVDRGIRGYVIDFIYVSLIDFPVFNLADIYVVLSSILLLILILFYYRDDDFNWLRFPFSGQDFPRR